MTFEQWWGENYIWWFKKEDYQKSLNGKVYEAARAAWLASQEVKP